MPSRAISNYMYKMTQLRAIPQRINLGFVQFQLILTNLLIAFAIIFSLTLLIVRFKSKLQNK